MQDPSVQTDAASKQTSRLRSEGPFWVAALAIVIAATAVTARAITVTTSMPPGAKLAGPVTFLRADGSRLAVLGGIDGDLVLHSRKGKRTLIASAFDDGGDISMYNRDGELTMNLSTAAIEFNAERPKEPTKAGGGSITLYRKPEAKSIELDSFHQGGAIQVYDSKDRMTHAITGWPDATVPRIGGSKH